MYETNTKHNIRTQDQNNNLNIIGKKNQQNASTKMTASKQAEMIYLNFGTLASEIPCDMTEYKYFPIKETGVMNWYQCVGKYCLEWLVEDIQDLLQCNRKSNLQKEKDTKSNYFD